SVCGGDDKTAIAYLFEKRKYGLAAVIPAAPRGHGYVWHTRSTPELGDGSAPLARGTLKAEGEALEASMHTGLLRTIFGPRQVSRAGLMRYSNIQPISYLKANAAEVLKQLADEQEPLIITQNGEAKAVIQDVRSFEQTQETLALLKILALGSQEVEA